MTTFTLEDAIEERIEYLASLPEHARAVWIEAAHEVWLIEQMRERNAEPERTAGAAT